MKRFAAPTPWSTPCPKPERFGPCSMEEPIRKYNTMMMNSLNPNISTKKEGGKEGSGGGKVGWCRLTPGLRS